MSDFYTPYTGRDVFVLTACSGKQAFESGALAHRQMRTMKTRSKKLGKKRSAKHGREVYRCPVCRKWHIGGTR